MLLCPTQLQARECKAQTIVRVHTCARTHAHTDGQQGPRPPPPPHLGRTITNSATHTCVHARIGKPDQKEKAAQIRMKPPWKSRPCKVHVDSGTQELLRAWWAPGGAPSAGAACAGGSCLGGSREGSSCADWWCRALRSGWQAAHGREGSVAWEGGAGSTAGTHAVFARACEACPAGCAAGCRQGPTEAQHLHHRGHWRPASPETRHKRRAPGRRRGRPEIKTLRDSLPRSLSASCCAAVDPQRRRAPSDDQTAC